MLAGVISSTSQINANEHRIFPDGKSDTVIIQFRQSKWNLDKNLGDNKKLLDSIDRKLTYVEGDSIFSIRHVSVEGSASPEGSESFNRYLSKKRAETLFDHFSKYRKLTDADKTFEFKGRDWEAVLTLAGQDENIPYRDETLLLLREFIKDKESTGKFPKNALLRLKRLRGGKPYRYLYINIFPKVRTSRLTLEYNSRLSPAVSAPMLETLVKNHIDSLEVRSIASSYQEILAFQRPYSWLIGLRTNLLLDVLVLPNVGIEFPMMNHYSAGANILWGWWSRNRTHYFWRAYGGDIFLRRWFGKTKNINSSLTGHHIGIYGQVYTYDLELGGKGEMGGKPHGDIFDHFFWGAGIEYGYSIQLAKRLNLDFSASFGYTSGIYYSYLPDDDFSPGTPHYVWTGTHRRNYFGLTKAEITLVWLIGRKNTKSKRPDIDNIITEMDYQGKEVDNE